MQHLRALPAASAAPMAAPSSLEAVKRKIQCLQQQADEAEDRAQVLQRELDLERDLREKVRPPGLPARLSRSLSPGLPCSFLPVSGSLSLGRAWLSPAPGGRLGRRLPSFLSCPPRCSAPQNSLRKPPALLQRLARTVLRGHRARGGGSSQAPAAYRALGPFPSDKALRAPIGIGKRL